MIPGKLKAVKAIGWFIEEFGIAQVSMNLTNLNITPVHVAFDEACKSATERGLRVTGSELVGLIPLSAMLDAGRYFLRKQKRSTGVSDRELIKIAVKSLGLSDLYPFKPEEKVIEYALAKGEKPKKLLVGMPVRDFIEETASESPAPGGGSVSATVGALGVALGAMVAALSAQKWEDRWEEFSDWAERGKVMQEELLRLVDADTEAFNAMMAAMRLPKTTEAEQAARQKAMQEATKAGIEVPLRVMEKSLESMDLMKAMAETGNPNSVSDAGVGALCARTAVMGAFLNAHQLRRRRGQGLGGRGPDSRPGDGTSRKRAANGKSSRSSAPNSRRNVRSHPSRIATAERSRSRLSAERDRGIKDGTFHLPTFPRSPFPQTCVESVNV